MQLLFFSFLPLLLRFDLIDTFRPVLIDRGTKCLVSKKNAEFLPRHYL